LGFVAVLAVLLLGGSVVDAKPIAVARRIVTSHGAEVAQGGSQKVSKCDITEILASTQNPGKGIPGTLSKFKQILSASQFGAYNTFTLASQQSVNAPINKPTAVGKFTNGDIMTLNFKAKVVAQGKKPRDTFDVTVITPSGTQVLETTITFDVNHVEMPYVTNTNGGALIVALSCN
jgi:hypothetical protein